MDGSPDPLVVILGAVALAVVTIGGIFVVTLLGARYAQRSIPSTEETHRGLEEMQEAYSAILKWTMPFSFAVIALTVGAAALAINGHPALFGVVLVVLVPTSLVVYGLSMVRTRVAIVRRPLRWHDRVLTGQEAVRRGRALIAIGFGVLLICLLLSLLVLTGGGSVGGLSWPVPKATP